MSGFPEQEYI